MAPSTRPFESGPWSGIDAESERNWTNDGEPTCPTSAIWMGNFNAEPGSTEYKRMTGPSPYYANPRYRDRLVDSTVAAGHAPDALISHTGEDEDGVTRSHPNHHCLVNCR